MVLRAQSLERTSNESGPLVARSSSTRSRARPPEPVQAKIRLRVMEERSGRTLDATLTEVNYFGPQPRLGAKHELRGGLGVLNIPATARLRAEAPGFEPMTLSPLFDNPPLIETVTRLEDKDLIELAHVRADSDPFEQRGSHLRTEAGASAMRDTRRKCPRLAAPNAVNRRRCQGCCKPDAQSKRCWDAQGRPSGRSLPDRGTEYLGILNA